MALAQLYRERETYKNLLERIMEEQANVPKEKYKQLVLFSKPDRVRVSTTAYQSKTQRRVELIYPTESASASEREEVICSVQGFIVRARLPPITSRSQLSKSPASAKQSIMLTGLGAPGFDDCARGILEVFAKLASVLPTDSLQPWEPMKDQGHICLEFSNRYYATENELTDQDSISLNPLIDPLGILAENVPHGRHTEDNVVLYFDRVVNTGQTATARNYVACNPATIKPGQLVEAQVSFCAVPVAKGKYRMLSKLRSVCILNRQVQKDVDDALIERMRGQPSSPLKKVKRNIGYGNVEDDEQPDERLKRLRLTDDTRHPNRMDDE